MASDTIALSDGQVHLEPTSGKENVLGWSVTVDDERVGTAALLHGSSTTAIARWNLHDDDADGDMDRAIRVVGLLRDHAFGELGYRRVEMRVSVEALSSVRVASICGFRREGIVRRPGSDADDVLLARLIDDPPADTPEGFIALLNAGLPTKRVIVQGLLRDEQDRVLLCRLTYKQEWDLPGGVVEVGEAPAIALVRELQEELGITVTVYDLITVNWLPAWRGWDDACLMLFDLGVVDSALSQRMQLQPTEIAGVEWCDEPTIESKATAATRELLTAVRAGSIPGYREASTGRAG